MVKVRYIRDWLGKDNNVYPGNHWIEIEAYSNGQNVALGKTVTIVVGTLTGWTGAQVVTDGLKGEFVQLLAVDQKAAIQVDLGELFDVQEIKVWHYYADERTYYATKTDVSKDGVNWLAAFDSKIDGEYSEKAEGHSINLEGLVFPSHFEQTAQENILLVSVAAQSYTPNGYHYEATTGQTINPLIQESTQMHGTHFEQFGTEFITSEIISNVEYQGNFKAFANETIPLFSSKASCEVVNAFFFDGIAQKNIELVIQAQIEYEHRNAFEGKTFETLYFEDFGTFEVTTEPRNYEMEKQVFLNLVFNSWVYFERDIYKPTYKIEVEKPNTLYVPTIEDRERLEQNTFGRKPTYKIDRRILKLTDIGQLKK